jgi:hypothetical protein
MLCLTGFTLHDLVTFLSHLFMAQFLSLEEEYIYSEFRYMAAELLFNVPWFKFLVVVVLSGSDGKARQRSHQ